MGVEKTSRRDTFRRTGTVEYEIAERTMRYRFALNNFYNGMLAREKRANCTSVSNQRAALPPTQFCIKSKNAVACCKIIFSIYSKTIVRHVGLGRLRNIGCSSC